MSLTKYATFEQAEVLDLKGAPTQSRHASLEHLADFDNYRTGDGYIYARIRAISSRVNRNSDGWPSVELAGSPEIFERHHSARGFTIEAADGNPEYGFSTFVGKPVFVDHHNSNPKKARGVIVDAKLNVLDQKTSSGDDYWTSSDVDHEHLPPTEVELLLEVDAKSFPRLAHAIVNGDLDGFSMGCDVEHSKCSHCDHIASSPDEYCAHIVMKGATHDYKTADGKRTSKKSYENCYGIKFFEISAVFDPADETALAREVRSAVNKEAEYGEDYGVEPGMNEDPMAPGYEQIKDLAMQYVQKGVDMQTALDMAKRQVQMPGHGEGDVYSPKRVDYMRSDPTGMPLDPQGHATFPPPVRPGGPGSAFGEAGEEALNEAWPQRPVMNDPYMSKTAQNPLPQEMMTRAPDEIDTLRDERLCPICGADMTEETCDVCGYVEPPKEFDNPDLDQATLIREKMKEQEESVTNEQQPQPGQPGEQIGEPQQPGGPLTSQQPKKAPQIAGVKSDMSWTPKVHPKTAGRINQIERPISPSNPPQSDEPRQEIVIKDQTRPVTAAMATARQLMANAQRKHGDTMQTRTADGPTPPGDTSAELRTDVTGVGGVTDASNDAASKADAQVDVTGIGSTGLTDVSPDKTETIPTAGQDSDDSGFNTDKTTDDSGPTATFGDSDGSHSGVGDPVTSVPFPASEDGVKKSRIAYEDGTLEGLDQQGDPVAQGGSAVQGTQPVDSVATPSYKRVNVLEHTTSPSNNSGPTDTWSGTDGNSVTKQVDPVSSETSDWGGIKVPDVQLHTGRVSIAALRLAEMEIELGLRDRETKWNRMAELDQEDPAILHAQLKTLSGVKTAGLNKLAARRQSGVTRLPRFQRIATGAEQTEQAPVSDADLDAGLFLR